MSFRFRYTLSPAGVRGRKSAAESDWPVFLGILAEMARSYENEQKLEVPALYPFTRAEGATRADSSAVEAHTGGLYDVDAGTPEFAAETLRRLIARARAFAMWVTWSQHEKGTPRGLVRFRVLVPWAPDVTPSRWVNARARDMSDLGLSGEVDSNTHRETQPGFLPARPPGAPAPLIWYLDAPPVDPFALADSRSVTGASLLAYGRQLARSKSRKREIGQAIVEALGPHKGPFADPGGRDSVAWQIACTLANEYPDADPDALAQHFEPSCAVMDPNSFERLREKFGRAWGGVDRTSSADRSHIEAFWARHGQPGRTEPYTSDERETIAEAHGKNGGVRWILRSSDGVSFLTLDGYTAPVPVEVAASAAAIELAPSPVRLRTPDDRPLPIDAVIDRVGSHATRIEWSMYPVEGRPAGSLNPETGALTLLGAQLRPFTYLRSPIVEEWLGLMFGAQWPRVRKWLALLPDLRHPLAALYAFGAKSVGKNLLACGIAAGWVDSGQPTDLAKVLGENSWTANLLTCPFTWSDEYFPRDRDGRPMLGELRKFVSAMSHTYRRKFKDESTIVGCARVLITSNEELSFVARNAVLDNEAIEAIAERILAVRVGPESARFLKSLPHDRKVEIAKEGLWRHILYEQIGTEREDRFGVIVHDRTFADKLAVMSGVRPLLCQWVVAWLTGERDAQGAKGAARVRGGFVQLSPRGLYEAWRAHLGDVHRPDSIGTLADAARSLGTGAVEGGWVTLATDRLVAWAEHSGFASRLEIESAISRRKLEVVK